MLWGSRGYAPGQARPLLQGEELSLPFQSTLLSVPLQRGWVPLRGRNELMAGPEGMEPERSGLMLTESKVLCIPEAALKGCQRCTGLLTRIKRIT